MAAPARVLIVDDHPLFVEALQRAIVSAFPGTATREAISIEAAKKVLESKEPFDIVLLDLALPGTRGFDGLLELRKLHPSPADRCRLGPRRPAHHSGCHALWRRRIRFQIRRSI